MSKKRQRQQHDDLWNLYVQACGSLCGACREDRPPYQRGHIQRDADGGPGDLSNLIPICKRCNGIYSKTTTPDHRPASWKSDFIRLLIQHFGLGITWHATSPSGTPHTGTASAENERFIPLEEVDFRPDSRYLPAYVDTNIPSQGEVEAAVETLVRLGRKEDVTIPPPPSATLDKLRGLVRTFGTKAFVAVGKEFLASGDWFDSRGNFTERLMRGQEWERFCGNFVMYQGDWLRRLKREAAEAEAMRQTEERIRKEDEARRKLESDPEYIRQQAEAHLKARFDDVRAAKTEIHLEQAKTRWKNAFWNRWHRALDSLGTLTDEQEALTFELKKLVVGNSREQFLQFMEEAEALLLKLQNPS